MRSTPRAPAALRTNVPMNDVAALPALPALPEIVLALSAMALLMLGAFRGEHTAVTVGNGDHRLVAAGAITLWLPSGTLDLQGNIVDPLRASSASGADRLGRRHPDVVRLSGGRSGSVPV